MSDDANVGMRVMLKKKMFRKTGIMLKEESAMGGEKKKRWRQTDPI